ncbi:hypothetical protein O6H91_09G110600 [Diphasiastrum complanatum]|uniref:Uncharacterized protein n=1 Tax=Diphasiastrum complanatum TaxID=34168 RepID=A0ACC2CT52_DIPCM|nr:hypothetical protein O6H91_09G110600 [Diphasiastrum complanatum]
MNGHASVHLLQQFWRDRRELLAFLLSPSSLYKRVLPPGAISLNDVNLDEVSVDYILDCLSKGCAVDISEAIWRFHNDLTMPPMIDSKFGEVYFLVTTPEMSGPPPARMPPVATASSPSCSGPLKSSLVCLSEEMTFEDELEDSDDGQDDEELVEEITRHKFALILPPFSTRLSEYDLREAAYEVLLVSVDVAGGLISSMKEKKERKKSKLGRRLRRSKPANHESQASHATGLAGLLETMRTQMEVSEAFDRRTRKALMQLSAGLAGKRMDTLFVPLELLCILSSADFSDRRAYTRWQQRQLNIIEEGLVHHHPISRNPSDPMCKELGLLIAKVEKAEQNSPSGVAERAKALKEIRSFGLSLAKGSGARDQVVDVCHWADGYHLNVRLYEKLLCSVFDILDEGQLTEEVEEILELLKSTWRMLGITQTVHETCYAWVFFRQFVLTGELSLLQHATHHIKKIALHGDRASLEKSYMKVFPSTIEGYHDLEQLSHVQSTIIPIKLWIDEQLDDYHLHFSENLDKMEELVVLAMAAGQLLADEYVQREIDRSSTAKVAAAPKQAEDYVLSSVKHAYERVLEQLDTKSGPEVDNPLVVLAKNVELLAKKDASKFAPILSRWQPCVKAITASLLHSLFHKELKTFLDGASYLGDDVSSVLPSANSLEQYLLELMASVDDVDESSKFFYKQHLSPYQIEAVSAPLMMRWVNAQLARLSDWVDRTARQENWEAVSIQQSHGKSIVEVFRIIEEITEQFFNLTLPIRMPILKTLTNGFDKALQLYSNKVISDLELIPPVPILTRYNEDLFMRGHLKRKTVEAQLLDEKRIFEINLLTTSKLCIRLNTLYYTLRQVDMLEDNIRERWATKELRYEFNSTTGSITRLRPSNGDLKSKQSKGARPTDELSSCLNGSRKEVNMAIEKICDFTGTKIIYWDMRDSYINGLYKGGILKSRIDIVVSGLDIVLGQICDIIKEPLRDLLVRHLLQASMGGFVRVLLDGGPFRAFSRSDADILQEDLHLLKEFFIADGDGLFPEAVENTAALAEQALKLHQLETHILIKTLRHASQQMVVGIDIQKVGGSSSSDVKTLLRVLCHRMDRDASKFLKKSYRIPKTVE